MGLGTTSSRFSTLFCITYLSFKKSYRLAQATLKNTLSAVFSQICPLEVEKKFKKLFFHVICFFYVSATFFSLSINHSYALLTFFVPHFKLDHEVFIHKNSSSEKTTLEGVGCVWMATISSYNKNKKVKNTEVLRHEENTQQQNLTV